MPDLLPAERVVARWLLIGLICLSVGGSALWWWVDTQSSEVPAKIVETKPTNNSSTGQTQAVPTPAGDASSTPPSSRKLPTGQAPAAIALEARLALEEQVVAEPDLPLSQTQAAAQWSFAEYAAATSNVDAIDGETAFAAYEFARSCVGEPRSDRQFEFRLEQFNQYFDDNRRRVSENRLNRAMDRLQDEFVRCQEFSADTDLVRTAADWLMLAADLGYLPAQVRFYNELPALLRETQARVFAEPSYLDMHREKSIDYLDRALLSGHPRAFLAMSIALSDAVIFEFDALATAAYAEAADLAAHGLDPQIGERKVRLNQALSPAQQRDAEIWGADLCRRYCRLKN